MQPIIPQWKAGGLEVMLITSDPPQEVSEFLKQHPMEVTVLFDTRGEVGQLYGVRGIPNGFLVDRQGKVVYRSLGWGRNSFSELETEIAKVLD
ncbi:MAG: TlpA family protein disulfide reductase [Syntrophomonadaceae bacterium]|nr:TlpA family protein disulfide reductase [Syntrophomonadaceae bacterium]